jgi:hypothetical protein
MTDYSADRKASNPNTGLPQRNASDPCAFEAEAVLNCVVGKDYNKETCIQLVDTLRACALKHVRSIEE